MDKTQETRLNELLEKYAANQADTAEVSEMLDLLQVYGADEVLKTFTLAQKDYVHTETADWDKIWSRIEPARVRTINWKLVSIAASILLVLGFGWYFIAFSPGKDPAAITKTNDIEPPATNRARITLPGGKVIYLDSASNGALTRQDEVEVVKLANGQIAYKGNSTNIIFNTLTNPAGSQVIDMTLADGSRVWLNAGSSITYPIAFIKDERKVSVTGEAYFEISHDASKPFIVTKGEMEVAVLGTHFNVNAFEDERDIKVTLLEGSVKVSKLPANDMRLLAPGQQAIVASNSPITINLSPDIEQVMAWKNGRFVFKATDIETIMRQVARWYNVQIIYNGKINDAFYAEIPRNTVVSDLLKALELTGKVHFTIEGRKIIVNP